MAVTPPQHDGAPHPLLPAAAVVVVDCVRTEPMAPLPPEPVSGVDDCVAACIALAGVNEMLNLLIDCVMEAVGRRLARDDCMADWKAWRPPRKKRPLMAKRATAALRCGTVDDGQRERSARCVANDNELCDGMRRMKRTHEWTGTAIATHKDSEQTAAEGSCRCRDVSHPNASTVATH